MTEEVRGREEALILSEDDRARVAKLRLQNRGHGIDPTMHESFEHILKELTGEPKRLWQCKCGELPTLLTGNLHSICSRRSDAAVR